MKLLKWLTTGAALLAFGMSSAVAADKAKQEEVLKAAHTALQEFYKKDPKIKAKAESAPGYAVFSTFGISFLIGGSGGKGIVHDNATKKNTFMDLATGERRTPDRRGRDPLPVHLQGQGQHAAVHR